MTKDKLTIFYKIKNSADWHYKITSMTFKECEMFCKQQNYADYNIVNLDNYSAFDLHLLTDVIRFNGKHYFSAYNPQGESIPYPQTETTTIFFSELSLYLF